MLDDDSMVRAREGKTLILMLENLGVLMNGAFLAIALLVIRSGTLSGITPFMANDVAAKQTLQGGKRASCGACHWLRVTHRPQRMPTKPTIREALFQPPLT